MKYRKLGRTDMNVSVVAMGCWVFAGGRVWGEQEDKESIATVDAALEAGINFFDTAEAYGDGRSEEVLGRALKGRRDKVYIATKVSRSNLRRDDVLAACEASLRRLDTEYIDIYQVHWPNWGVPFAETMSAFRQLQDEGKIRAIAVSNFGVRDLGDLLEIAKPQSNQLPYSLLWRAIEYGIVDACRENDVSILCYSPLAQGLLTGKWENADEVPYGRNFTRFYNSARGAARHHEEGYEDQVFAALDEIRDICAEVGEPMADVALAWLLHRPGVTSVLTGMRTVEQVQQNVRASGLQLAPETMQALAEATEELKAAIGPNPDMFQSDSRFR